MANPEISSSGSGCVSTFLAQLLGPQNAGLHLSLLAGVIGAKLRFFSELVYLCGDVNRCASSATLRTGHKNKVDTRNLYHDGFLYVLTTHTQKRTGHSRPRHDVSLFLVRESSAKRRGCRLVQPAVRSYQS
jgi:hypothetical protein